MHVDDQASKLRKLMRETRYSRTVSVVSGKGGVGKSNISLNLSILLSAAGNRVALVDADFGLANLDVLVDTDVSANLSHVIAGVRRLDEIVVDLPSGVQFVPGASGLAKLAHLSEFQRAKLLEELTALEANNEIIVIDCGAGIGPSVMHFAAAADIVLVVTTPEPTAITDGYAMVKVLAQQGYKGQVSLLVNFADSRHEARMTYDRISNVAGRFLGIRCLNAGYVPIDPRVRQAVFRREPFVLAYPNCHASRCLAALANKLSASGAMVDRKEGFFLRVANWFT
ncbi:MAG: MinD/ParA family protein [Planctomycetota bacterium]|nr:MinD/ParA family protein [Planctomycetota bacterium]